MPTRRHYNLSPDGLRRLRESVHKHRPWEKSTGPTSDAGKDRSSMNALRTGDYATPELVDDRSIVFCQFVRHAAEAHLDPNGLDFNMFRRWASRLAELEPENALAKTTARRLAQPFQNNGDPVQSEVQR